MYIDWLVQIEDGTHTIRAEFTMKWKHTILEVTWDGVEVCSLQAQPFGEICNFEREGHSFKFKGTVLESIESMVTNEPHIALYQDGVRIPWSARWDPFRDFCYGGLKLMFFQRDGASKMYRAATQLLGKNTEPTKAPTPPTPSVSSSDVQFVEDRIGFEAEEIVGNEQYPLDNRFGDQPFTTVRQVSRESTNELSVDSQYKGGVRIGGEIKVKLIASIKAEIEAEISRQTGRKIGEKVTESQTLTFSVGPRSSVLYQVIWKRRVRSGERVYLLGKNPITVPYKVSYGLSCEVRTHQQDTDAR
jgi:hypothetical protein